MSASDSLDVVKAAIAELPPEAAAELFLKARDMFAEHPGGKSK